MAARGKIFVSYRREDAPGEARSIYERLGRSFGEGNVFMDVDQLLAGQRFDRELDKALAECDVLIAVIGTRWMDVMSDYARRGKRDYVQDEIAAALRRHHRHPRHDGTGRQYAGTPAGGRASREYPRPSAVPETQHLARELRS